MRKTKKVRAVQHRKEMTRGDVIEVCNIIRGVNKVTGEVLFTLL